MTDNINLYFIKAIRKNPENRNLQDLQIIYCGLQTLEALATYHDSAIRSLSKTVRYEKHEANDVLYSTGELATCWYVLLSGSVFIDGCMFLPPNSIGQRTAGSARRPNECFVLEPSEMIVIDYSEMQSVYSNCTQRSTFRMDHRGVNIMFEDPSSNRDSQSSDTSSAYSGSDTISSIHSMEPEDIDLSGLIESVVDSDPDEPVDDGQIMNVRDKVRECLEKDPSDRTEDDVEVLLEFTQHLKAFTNITLSIRRALCSVMVFAIVEKAGTVVMNNGEELDSWSVIINGHVEIEHVNGRIDNLKCGDSFGILPTMEKLYHEGVMRTKCPDCQFVCITQTDYYRILHQGEENIKRHKNEDGKVVLVTEQRTINARDRSCKGYVVIRGTENMLISQLIEDNPVDSTYVEDFLLTFRTFIKNPSQITDQLMEWFQNTDTKERVTRIVVLWVKNHFTDFENDNVMMNFLENFEECLLEQNMVGQLRMLNVACTSKARVRCVTLTRSDRNEPLNFDVVGGFDRSTGIYVSAVEKGSKAEEIGLKRGDQILLVNGQSFQHITYDKAIETLRSSTHLSITVKANLNAMKEIMKTGDSVAANKNTRGKPSTSIAVLQPDPLRRDGNSSTMHSVSLHSTPTKNRNFMTLGPKRKIQKALQKISIFPRTNNYPDASDDCSISSGEQNEFTSHYHSQSQPDLVSMSYDEQNNDYPEHVLKVYKSDQIFKYLLVHKETTAHEVVMLALQEFGMTDPSSNFSLCEVSVTEDGIIKQKRLPDQMQNLADRQELCSRYYLKTNGVTETLVTDEIAADMVRESTVTFLQLNAAEVALQLTMQDYNVFRQIEPTEYIDDLFELKSNFGTPALTLFAELVNKEMFWVVTEICSETNLVKRSKIIKQFIKLARHCKEYKNFNSLFAVISGLGHASVMRLKQTWEKLPTKYSKSFTDLQNLMDPSRNMSKYRQLVASVSNSRALIPFYPVVKKDLTFIHLGNDSIIEGLINFEKLRMIAKEIRKLSDMCSLSYDLMLTEPGAPVGFGQGPVNAVVNPVSHGILTVKRRKKSAGALNQRKMYEEAQMVRRVKAYLAKIKVITDEEKLHELSIQCENLVTGPSSYSGNAPLRKCNPSPTLSTASSTSSTSEGRKATAPKFGSASPQTVRKLLSLSEQCKTRPHQSRHAISSAIGPLGRVPNVIKPAAALISSTHERSYSDTSVPHQDFHPSALMSAVDLNAESSSVTSLSNLPLRKNLTGNNSCVTDRSGMPRPAPPYSNMPPIPSKMYIHGRSYSHEGVTRPYRDVSQDEDGSFGKHV
ncbi:rap guanine nucleotide exchange factor 6-like isoform X2 [Planococcus citri]|uniref:rap guanine nucleotide exchange factor 6-like isoform X2 n=1 Tax=Planococcus citri TaxID=170843 RepID=UPI0031F88F4E